MNTSLPVIFVLAIVSMTFAQETVPDSASMSDTPEYSLAPVVVTATRHDRPLNQVPYAVTIIDQSRIQRAEIGLSLEEALHAVPGVAVNNRFNLSQGDQISMRGMGSRASFGVRGIKIILDGIPLSLADGQSQLNNLDLGSVGTIEVLRGPSSSLYGNAAGGLINIQTEDAAATPLRVEPGFIGGAYDLQKWQGKISGQIKQHDYFISVNRLTLAGFREHSAAKSTAVNAVSRHAISKNLRLTAAINYFDAPYLLNPSALSKPEAENSPTSARSFVKQQGAGKKTSQTQAGVTLKYIEGRSTQFEATFYGLSRALLNPIPGRIIELDRKAGGVRAVFSQRLRQRLRLTAGFDVDVQDDQRVEFENAGIPSAQVEGLEAKDIFSVLRYGARVLDQTEQVLGLGPFVEFEFTPDTQWGLTLGMRYDRSRFQVTDQFLADGIDDSGVIKMKQLSPMIGLTHRPSESFALYGNVATAFQTPTTTELSNRPTGEGGLNPELQPEKMTSIEIGLKGGGRTARFSYNFAVYEMQLTDMLIPYQIQTGESEEVYFRNAGKAQNRGLEAGLAWSPLRDLQASFAYTRTDFVFKDFVVETSAGQFSQLAGKTIPGVAPHRLFAGLVYEYARGVYAECNVQWVEKFFANDFNGPPPGSNKPQDEFVNNAYFTVEFRLGARQSFTGIGVELFLGINNVFDKRYNGSIVPNAAGDRFFEPAAGRSWYVGGKIPMWTR